MAFDQYLGVGYEAKDDLIDGAALWLKGDSIGNVGFLPPFATSMSEWSTVFQPTATLGSGTVRAWLDVTDGEVEPLITQVDPFFDSGRATAHTYLNMTTDVSNATNKPDEFNGQDWTVQSNDDVVGAAIPEPITMLGLGLAVAGLGGYIRRRRQS